MCQSLNEYIINQALWKAVLVYLEHFYNFMLTSLGDLWELIALSSFFKYEKLKLNGMCCVEQLQDSKLGFHGSEIHFLNLI